MNLDTSQPKIEKRMFAIKHICFSLQTAYKILTSKALTEKWFMSIHSKHSMELLTK